MKKIVLTITLMVFCQVLWALPPQHREVVMDTIVNSSAQKIEEAISQYFYQFQACPDSLFSWAYMGLGSVEPDPGPDAPAEKRKKSSNSPDALALVYKDRVYNAETREGDVAIDIIVLGTPWWKDQHLCTICEGDSMSATYSGSLLEGGEIVFKVLPGQDGRTVVSYRFSLTFGRGLSLFITDKIWNNVIDWRLKQIFRNLMEFSEKGYVSKPEPAKLQS